MQAEKHFNTTSVSPQISFLSAENPQIGNCTFTIEKSALNRVKTSKMVPQDAIKNSFRGKLSFYVYVELPEIDNGRQARKVEKVKTFTKRYVPNSYERVEAKVLERVIVKP